MVPECFDPLHLTLDPRFNFLHHRDHPRLTELNECRKWNTIRTHQVFRQLGSICLSWRVLLSNFWSIGNNGVFSFTPLGNHIICCKGGIRLGIRDYALSFSIITSLPAETHGDLAKVSKKKRCYNYSLLKVSSIKSCAANEQILVNQIYRHNIWDKKVVIHQTSLTLLNVPPYYPNVNHDF